MFRFVIALSLLAPAVPAAAEPVNFNRDVRPLLTENCFPCHGPDPGSRKAGMRLDLAEHAAKPAKSGAVPIVPGHPDRSELVKRILSADDDERMPPPEAHKSLKPEEKELFRRWIAEGAVYQGHWAFSVPVRPPVPPVAHPSSSVVPPPDAFVAARLERAGLSFSPEADRATLARRAALDLTGLPPSPEEMRTFVSDASPEAFDRFVDHLLASPHYGERWARMWMDIARYADSAGYGSDPLRLNIWPFRDWVIAAFNRNLPYDQFSREQLAGDLLPGAAEDQLIATAFHRNTMTNTEGGTDDEEWRVAAVKDRAGVTAQAWMGLTMNCAQCHTHKFDPISHREYYQFYALFNQTEDHDQPDERPTLPVVGVANKQQREQLLQEIAALEKKSMDGSVTALEAELAPWEAKLNDEKLWRVLDVMEFKSGGSQTVWEKLPDGSLLVRGEAQARSTYDVTALTPLRPLTGLRLEVLPDDSLPARGPGRASHGHAVVSEVTVRSAAGREVAPAARFVRIELPGKARYLHVAEVQVFAAGKNIASSGTASQVSTDFGGVASRAIDGNTDGDYHKSQSVSHTAQTNDPWLEIDLGSDQPVERVIVWNRADGGTGDRMKDWRLTAMNADRQPVFTQDFADPPNPSHETKLAAGSVSAELHRASATHSQDGWPAAHAIDGDKKTGWAFAPRFGEAHTAVFQFAKPVDHGAGHDVRLNIALEQNHGDQHVLGRFRLSVTDAPPPIPACPDALRPVLAKSPAQRTPEEKSALISFFRPHSLTHAALTAEIAAKKKALAAVASTPVPIMRELAGGKQRKSRLLNKGNFLDPGEEVQPGFPAAFGAPPDGTPANRLGLVAWLFSEKNPLTARVAVNRFWAQLFGTGLVETEEDFGMQGQYPSHPELLDWLAVEFRESGWDVKRLLKLIVTSRTYRQSSRTTPELMEKDPRARLLSRYPRRRLDAEEVRDQALALSGLLSPVIGGASVYPPQPDGLWKAAFNGERTYNTSKGGDKFRRGLYTIWRRTIPYPSMATFDAPSRETCTLRRTPTNTPLQAYVTLNDPVFVEAAQALARRIHKDGGATTAPRIHYALTLALAREPDSASAAALTKLYESEFARYSADPAAAQKLATDPLGPLPDGLSPAEAAAWTVVANVLLNLDGVLMKS